MHNHFDKFLNVKELIFRQRPKHIVECGALTGDNTKLLLSLKEELAFKLTVITDNDFEIPGADIKRGVSYRILTEMADDSIDMCIIDTDHNYWTLIEELKALHPKLRKDGLVLIHDVSTFYHDTGIAESYADGTPYPKDRIEEVGQSKGSLGTALMDWLSLNRFDYKMIRFSEESHGASAIKKVCVRGLFYYKPADRPMEVACQS